MKYLVLLSSVIFAVSCHIPYHDSISGNGEVKRVTISEDTIRSFTISNKLNAVIIPSDSFKVVLNADENLHEYIETDIYNGHLSIYSDKHIRMAKSKEVLIYTDCIERIEASAASNVYSKGTLNCGNLTIAISSASDIHLSGHFDEVNIQASSGSDIRLEGTANKAIINTSSASDLHAFDFIVQEANITASSASDARISVEKEARFNASSAADIKYLGDPEIIESRTSSAADIKKVRR